MEDHVNFQFPAQGMKLQDDRTQRSISPLSRTSSVLGGRNEDHRRIEEHKQHQIEITTPPDHQSILEQSENYEELDMPTGKGSEHTRAMDRWSRLPTDWWIWELLALLCSVISLVAIVLVLRLHEGRPVPDWPFSITINSLLSIFATIMSATMLVPIAEGIGQGKWHWFQQYHALRDMEVYDQASRGPWGALKMLWGIRWR